MTFSSEIWSEKTRKLSIDVRGGAVEAINDSFGAGVAVRTIEDGKLGFAYSTKAGEEETSLIEMARESAKKLERDEYEFPKPDESAKLNSTFDAKAFSKFSHEQKIEFALELEAGARGLDKRVTGVRKATYVEVASDVQIKNSEGLSSEFAHGFCYLSITAIAKDEPNTEWAGEIEYYLDPRHVDPRKVGEEAARKALAMLGARTIPSQSAPCLLDREATGELLELLSLSFFADQIFKKKSALAGKLGEQIYSNEISIVDDAGLKGAFSVSPFDGEGVATRRNVVVENGVFKTILCDSFWGKKLSLKSNGSSVRSSLTTPPKAGAHNIFIAAGKNSPDELRKKMWKGFYVTDLMGVHTANPITGEFSLGAGGFWVENGKISHAVKGVTVAGNLHDILRRTVAVGNDLKFWYGGGAPSILIESLHIAGN